ncbi:MAG: CinA family protein [Bacilli bacterium]|nr:CinA family protein [Bacilli bacterium]
MQQLIKKLQELNKTISTMESCLGGGLANEITNIEGASEVYKFSAITYSNEFKIKMGVSKEIIEKYSVYSIETADEMSLKISKYTNSNYGVGITGKLNRIDPANPHGENNIVFISIYDNDNEKFYHDEIRVNKPSRKENKKIIIERVKEMLQTIVK